MVTPKLLLNGS